MKLRWKFLVFLGVFLTGAFLMVAWKSYSLFGQRYAEMSQQKEIESLEQLSFYLDQRLQFVQSLFIKESPTTAQLGQYHVQLMAHVINEGGRWKAQWVEGEAGLRSQAHAMTKQISFETLSSSRASWNFIATKDKSRSLAYTIPAQTPTKNEFYTLFLDPTFLKEALLARQPQAEVVVVSPLIGEIFNSQKTPGLAEVFEKYKQQIMQTQRGTLPLNNRDYVAYTFDPDSQLYFFKSLPRPQLSMASSSSFTILLALVVVLIAIALVAQDALLKVVFQRTDRVLAELQNPQKSSLETLNSPMDELYELERWAQHTSSQPIQATVATKTTATKTADESKIEKPTPTKVAGSDSLQITNEKIKNGVIQCLGYVQKIKTSPTTATSFVALLEEELRQMRRELDPTSFASAADSLLKSTMTSSISKPEVITSSPTVEVGTGKIDIDEFLKKLKIESQTTLSEKSDLNNSDSSLGLTIPRPKRGSNEPRSV